MAPFELADLGGVVGAAELGPLADDDVEQFVVLRRLLPRQRDVERQAETAELVEVRVHLLLVDEALLPRPVRRGEAGAGVDDAACAQPVAVGVGQARVEESTITAIGSCSTRAISRGFGPDRNGTTIGTS